MRLLHVDDDDIDRMSVGRAFRKAAPEAPVESVSSGEAALQWLAQATDVRSLVVLLDLGLPGIGGLGVLERIRGDRRLRPVPVVVLTSSEDAKDRKEAYRLGASGYFVKPTRASEITELMAAIGDYWSRSSSRVAE
ncbi:MAG: response regulator [Alphaproteobacteria bacterium]|nr:response regulator [Alphaproteobacteria bacterium]